MKAIVHAGGGPDGLSLCDVAEPRAGPGERLIEVGLAGVNYADLIGLRTGNNFLGGRPGDAIPGGEVVGRRIDTGERVVAICGSGGYAERVAAPDNQIFPIPDDIDDATTLALFIQGLTAWHIVQTLGQPIKGARILIPSATGGVGLLALQIARSGSAARIVATTSSDAKSEMALRHGADAVIDGEPESFAARAIEANGGRLFDLVLDRSGGALFAEELAATGPRGRIVSYGTSSGQPGQLSTASLLAGSRSLAGFWLMDFLDESTAALRDIYALYRSGDVRPHIGLTLPLSEAAAAHRAIAARGTVGKLLLNPREMP